MHSQLDLNFIDGKCSLQKGGSSFKYVGIQLKQYFIGEAKNDFLL